MTRRRSFPNQIRRHVMCCGVTYKVDVIPAEDETPESAEWRVIGEVDAWAKNHLMTCAALKANDDDAQ